MKLTQQEIDNIYSERADKLKGVSKEVFLQALLAAESHFRHKMANIEHAKGLMGVVVDITKNKLKKAELEIKELKASTKEGA